MDTAKITGKQQGICGIITEMNQIMVWVVPITTSINNIKDSKSFDQKTSIVGKLEGNNVEKDDVKIVVLLKNLSNSWKTLDMPLIN